MSDSDHLMQVVKLIGLNPTIRLCRFSEGKTLKIPESQYMSFFHWLPVTVGIDNAFLICEQFSNQVLNIPRDTGELIKERNKLFLTEYQSGLDISGIARKHQIDRKIVQLVIHKAEREMQQQDNHDHE